MFLLLTCLIAKVKLISQRESKIKPPFFGIKLLAVAKMYFFYKYMLFLININVLLEEVMRFVWKQKVWKYCCNLNVRVAKGNLWVFLYFATE
jgi:hypothetical protein